MKNLHVTPLCYHVIYPSFILQAHPHWCKMNQNSKDTWNFLVKEIDVPKDAGELLVSLTNKKKEVGASSSGSSKINITIVEPFAGIFLPKKIMITNLNPVNIRKVEASSVELMESSYLSDSESDVEE